MSEGASGFDLIIERFIEGEKLPDNIFQILYVRKKNPHAALYGKKLITKPNIKLLSILRGLTYPRQEICLCPILRHKKTSIFFKIFKICVCVCGPPVEVRGQLLGVVLCTVGSGD